MSSVTRAGARVVGLASLLAACARPALPAESRAPLLEYVERVPADSARERLPLLVALHGRGGDASPFAAHFSGIHERARLLALRGPIVENNGRAWFVFRPDVASALKQMREVIPRVMATIAEYTAHHPTRGRPVLVGFSQGAILIYELARAAPRAFGTVFPIAGTQFEAPKRLPDGYPPVHAFHGERDEVIPIRSGAEAIELLRALGARAELTRIASAPHWMTPDLRAALTVQLEVALASQP